MTDARGESEPAVRFDEVPAGGGRRLGIARLNRPRRLNALDLDMCEQMLARFTAWASDPAIVAVMLAGEGGKGFCAGGDIGQVVRGVGTVAAAAPVASASAAVNSTPNVERSTDRFAYGDRFFTIEYRLNLALHTYPKPLITWAHGVTMGGGLGLSVAGSHRIIAEGVRIAMPEIQIGIFPDVGGGWFLNRVPGEAGYLIALTGVGLDASDAIYARFGDYRLPHDSRARFIAEFAAIEWGAEVADHRAQATYFCRAFEARHGPALANAAAASPLRQRYEVIRSLCTRAKLSGIFKGLREAAAQDPWFEPLLQQLRQASPTAAALTFEYLKRSRLLGIADVLALDRVLARQCLRHPDFPEGVRALLIDKDKSPQWSPKNPEDVGADLLETFFTPIG